MDLIKGAYQIGYRFFRMPYDIGPDPHLSALVESGRIPPCRAIDIGCGAGRNTIYLAQKGFEATGIDYSSEGIAKAREKAKKLGVKAEFIVDDLTRLRSVSGPFDLVVDIGVLDVFPRKDRPAYVDSIMQLTRPGGLCYLSGWQWKPRWWERTLAGNRVSFEKGEIEERFGKTFEIESIRQETNPGARGPGYFLGIGKPPGFAVYLMTRR